MILPAAYYRSDDVLFLARDLLGKTLNTRIEGVVTGGIITETEAYDGVRDRASHAFGGRRTKRTETMYSEGGVAYVYLCYGIHRLFNVVTGPRDNPQAVLIRAIAPNRGIPHILRRRKAVKISPALCTGPGKVTGALGIGLEHNGLSLNGRTIWLEDNGLSVPETEIITGPRIGVDYAGADAKLPYRFYTKLFTQQA